MGKKRLFAALLCIAMIVMVLFAGMTVSYAASKLPAPKTKISTVASSGKPRLTWDAVKGAKKYEVYRATSKNGKYSRMATGSTPKYTNTSATPGATYYYKVRAVDAKGNKGAFSSVKYITCDCARPVVSIGRSSSAGKPRLTWKAVSGASKYWVYRATSKNGTYKLIKTTTGTSYTNSSAVNGKTYYYKVKAVCKASVNGNSALSTAKSAAAGNTKITVTLELNASSGKPTVKWNEVDGAAEYEVYRAESKNGTYKRMATETSTKYTNTSAVPGKTYYYKVRAVDKQGKKGAFSAVKSIICDCARPTLSIGLTSSTGKPKLTWKAVNGASKYWIYRAESKNGTYKLIKTTEETSYTNSSAVNGKTYYYKVKAVCEVSLSGNSAMSPVKSITCGGSASGGETTGGTTTGGTTSGGVIGKVVCTAKSSMNLRSGPGTSYAKSGQLKAGVKVSFYEVQDNWYKIKLDGKYHWASGDYLEEVQEEESEPNGTDKYAAFPVAKNKKLAGKIVFLDPGHGNGGGGAYADYAEHIYNLKHAKLIRQSLENSGATVIMTRTDNTNVDNYARVSMANKYTLELLKKDRQSDLKKLNADGTSSQTKINALQAEIKELDRLIGVMQSVIDDPKLADTYYLSPYDLANGRAAHADLKKIFEYQKDPALNHVIYVSIHSNATANGGTSTNGTVTFFMDNAMNKKYYAGYQVSKNKKLATEICNEVVAAGEFAKRGVKVNDYFMVREVNIPSALLEIAFHTNANDRKKLMDPVVQKRVANAVTYAIMDYFA